MKRFHVHLAVEDLPRSIGFYTTLFGVAPSVIKDDYARWMLDDPRVNFAISMRGRDPGLDHLGIQVETPIELDDVVGRLKVAQQPLQEQRGTTCCYARSDKAWVEDPQQIPWETFHTLGEATVYGEDLRSSACGSPMLPEKNRPHEAKSCCAPSCC